MFLKCIFLLLFCCLIETSCSSYRREYSQSRYQTSRCPVPDNVRVIQRNKFSKFSCPARYTLVGHKYGVCRFRQWDVPTPVCVKSGCEDLGEVKNAVNQTLHNNAWVVFFCLPGHTLMGSPVLYCDGTNWNSTAPYCLDSSAQPKTSCDFEDGLCGWTQDETHDFDWRRLNRKTPSSYMQTGPPYDHTLGSNGTGNYMYIEATARLVNDTARLLSPVYDVSLTSDGCFAFYYHMFGIHIGGLRVYQKPDSIPMNDMSRYSEDDKNKYLLFEQWGNKGDFWYTGVAKLLNFSEDFQIVIEGIRGNGFISDIAIDDVSILQGENCTNLVQRATTPTPLNYNLDSCVNRCGIQMTDPAACNCDPYTCYLANACCQDYLDVCLFDNANSESTTEELPQTQKLVASSPISTTQSSAPVPTTIRTTTLSPTTTTMKPAPTVRPAPSMRPALTMRPAPSMRPSRLTPITRPMPTTMSTGTTPGTMSTGTTLTRPTITQRVRPKPLTSPTTRLTTTSPTPTTTHATVISSTPRTTTRLSTLWPRTTLIYIMTVTSQKEAGTSLTPRSLAIDTKKSGSHGVLTAVIVLLVLGICCGMLYGGYFMRSSRGTAALARMRGRASRDPEVRFLKSDDVDDE